MGQDYQWGKWFVNILWIINNIIKVSNLKNNIANDLIKLKLRSETRVSVIDFFVREVIWDKHIFNYRYYNIILQFNRWEHAPSKK
jgi:hypothetical protein